MIPFEFQLQLASKHRPSFYRRLVRHSRLMMPANPADSKSDNWSEVAAVFAISIKAVPYKIPLAPPTLEIKAIAVALKTSCKVWDYH